METLEGDVRTFHELWLRATTSAPTSSTLVGGIAGRRVELAQVREHLEGGSGVMVVAGEAGIGKTKLVLTAARSARTFVALGHCLPLSTQAPLMPVGDVLRAIREVDEGRRLAEALAAAPPYVPETLAQLLPELGPFQEFPVEFSRQRLFAAVSTCLSYVHSRGGLGLLVEDLHWADTATLDLLEHVVAGGLEVPVVATWRSDDPDTGDAQLDWWLRMRRQSAVATLNLEPLSREESHEQCRLLGLELGEASLDRIQARSQGQPLFTEQLAAHATGDGDLPEVLADLLDHRLARLNEPAHVITRTLGVADRGLRPSVLTAATRLEEGTFVRALRELTRAHLLAETNASGEVQLRHPLLAEAARRRLVPGEAATAHRALAVVLSVEPEATAAEVAEHWRGAGDHQRELDWRISAARAARAQWAASQAAEHWLRTLEVWPSARQKAGDPPVTRPEAYLAAMDALKDSLQFDRALAMSADATAQFPDLEPSLRAEFLRRASIFRTDIDGPEVGLELAEEAIEILKDRPVDEGMVLAMVRKHQVLTRMGRYAEALDVAHDAVVAAETVGDRMSQLLLLGHVAWHEAVIDGDMTRASLTIARAQSVSSANEDPAGDIWLAVIWTDVLLILGAGSADVLSAGCDALTLADERGIPDFGPVLLRYNLVKSLIDHGSLSAAAEMLGPSAQREVDLDRAPTFVARALLDALSGRLDDAAATVNALRGGTMKLVDDLDLATVIATVELWRARPQEAWSHLQLALNTHIDVMPQAQLLPPLVVAARALADLAAKGATGAGDLREQLVDLHQRVTSGRPTATPVHGRALAATWSAELARLDDVDSKHVWLAAEREWRALGRPHDAAYCGWRAARAALRHGEGSAATRLLARATTDARGYQPLLGAIAATRLTGAEPRDRWTSLDP